MKKLVLFGEEFRESKLNPNDYEALEQVVGYSWSYIWVAFGREAKALRRGSAVLLQRRLGLSEQDALAKVDSLTMVELNVCLVDDTEGELPKEWDDGLPPEADEG